MSNVTHSRTVVTADDGVSEVGSDEWNATHYQTIPNSGAQLEVDHMALSQRLIAQGTGRLTVREPLQLFKGSYMMGSIQATNDTYVLQYKRASLAGTARADLAGTADLFIFDLAPVGRLVLAGRGG